MFFIGREGQKCPFLFLLQLKLKTAIIGVLCKIIRMNINIQSLYAIDGVVASYLKREPNASMSGLFKLIRKSSKVSLIGDYPVMQRIYYLRNKIIGRKFNRNQIDRAFIYSEELRDIKFNARNELVKNLG